MAVSQVITAIPVAGHRGVDAQSLFVTKQEAFQDALVATTVTQLNTAFGQINTTETNVNAKEASAVASAATATAQAGTATTQAGLSDTARIASQLAESNASASAASAAAIAGAFVGTSTTSLLIATGSKSFTTQLNEQYTAGVFLSAVSAANTANFMFGQVTSYDATTGALVINVSVIGGSGTFADWNISLTGAQGTKGDTGATGATFTGGSLTSALNTARATVISSATTSDIWSALGNQIDWTGTATTTIFPNAPQAGAERTLICAGASSFTAGVNMLIDGVLSGATVTCAAMDKVTVRAITTSQFNLSRQKADGTAQVAAVKMINNRTYFLGGF